eukprot:207485-Prymnesium_polylepis.1
MTSDQRVYNRGPAELQRARAAIAWLEHEIAGAGRELRLGVQPKLDIPRRHPWLKSSPDGAGREL